MTSKFRVAAWTRVATIVGLTLFVLLASLSFAQQLTGTLSGTVVDSADAVVPNAQITFKNESSGDVRTSATNGAGYFSITAIQPGSYSITITAAGFKTWRQSGIVFNQGDSRSLPHIGLQVGEAKETVEITAGAEVAIPDNAEVSTTLNTHMVQDLALAGRDAGELLKLMPGMALTSGNQQGSTFNTKTVGTNSGPVGAYSSNGTQPNGAMAFMLDGANLVDPGNAGTQIANINQDMVAEVKVLMSSYSAEYAKGPTIFQAISKSGGAQYHGEGYMYARNSVFNSWDYNQKRQYLGFLANGNSPTAAPSIALVKSLKPDEHFYYYGGNVGGPIRFPGMGFNKNKDKAFFWVGYEYMNQHPAGQIYSMHNPTPQNWAGDFSGNEYSPAQLAGMNSVGYTYAITQLWSAPACGSATSIAGCAFDPVAVAYSKLYPTPNVQPSQYNGWNNWQYVNTSPQNRWELTGKVDYAFSDNTKLTVSYTRQIETDQHPVSIWWSPNWTLPYPGGVQAATTSQDLMSNFTHVFSPSTTNEFVFTYARYINPSTLSNPAASDRTKLGMNITGLFGHTAKQMPQLIPQWGGSMGEFRMQSFDGGFQGSAFGAIKRDPAFYDNFTKVIGAHTIKTGFYWDSNGNIQSNGGDDNGTINLGTWGGNNDTGNEVASFLLGQIASYTQASAVPVQTLQYRTYAAYAQDSFKANRQLTLNYGLRFDHLGQWYGGGNSGFQVWDPASYVNGTPQNPFNCPVGGCGSTLPNPNTGFLWHARNSKIPLSGYKSPWAYLEPRVGLAYDIFGTGKTVLRAGYAVFRYQFAENDVLGAAGGPAGLFDATGPQLKPITAGGPGIAAGIAAIVPPSSSVQNGASSVQALLQGDDQTPRVADWNVTISQALPWRSVFEASYVANKSTGQLINGNNDRVGDINPDLPGAYFRNNPLLVTASLPDGLPISGSPLPCNQSNAHNNYVNCGQNGPYNQPLSTLYANTLGTAQKNAYRPLTQYGDIYLISHGGYANYNSLQASWQKQSGPITFLTNYTFSKVLGTRDGQTDNGAGNGRAVDPFNLKNNYGPLAYDHTHILNLSYVWNMPKFVHGSKILGGVINGWQLSGYTTYQSGSPLQPNTGGNLNTGFAGGLTVPLVGTQLASGSNLLPDNSILLPNGLRANGVNPAVWYGTDSGGGGYQVMVPKVTCDPLKGLKSGQRFNPNCFTTPNFGELGTLQMPYIRNPGYFNSDLAIFKNFQINERQRLQFRLSATNFLNHPLPQFGLNGNGDISLNLQKSTPLTIPSTTTNAAGNSVCGDLGLTVTAGSCTYNVISIAPTNTNTLTTGKPNSKTGSRALTFSMKYYF